MKKSSNAKTVAGKKLKTLEHFLTVLAQTTKPLLIYFSVKNTVLFLRFVITLDLGVFADPKNGFICLVWILQNLKKLFYQLELKLNFSWWIVRFESCHVSSH